MKRPGLCSLLLTAAWLVASCGASSTSGPAPVIESALPPRAATADTVTTGENDGSGATPSATPAALDATAVAEAPTPPPTTGIQIGADGVATPAPTPTADPARDEALIAAAKTTFEAGRGNTSVAWDYVGAQVMNALSVQLTVCAWGGDTAFDQLLDLRYRIARDQTSDTVTATYASVAPAAGECLNTALVESALVFIDAHDTFWTAVLADPTSFDIDAAAVYLASTHLQRMSAAVGEWIDEGVHFEGKGFVGDLPASALREVLWRRYDAPAGSVLGILVCREMDARSGTYEGEERVVDDAIAGSGSHSLIEYQLVRVGDTWRMAGGTSVLGADCLSTDDWVRDLNRQQSAAPWQPLPN